MDVVVDTNVLVSAMLRNGLNRRLVFSNQLTLFSPLYFLAEFSERQDEYLVKAERDRSVFQALLHRICARVTIVPASELNTFRAEALAVCPHHKDWPFFAVALMTNCGIWTHESRLKDQNSVPVYSTADLADLV